MRVDINLALIRERREAIIAGDPARIAKQREAGKITARERVTALLDTASFVELDALAARDGMSGVVTGYGLVENRPVYLYAQDFTVKAGAVGKEHSRKVLKVMDLAESTGAPLIALLDSAGARFDEGMEAVDAYARMMARAGQLSGVVPQISLILGPCGGGAAMCAALSDLTLMSEQGSLFIYGPQLAAAATGREEDLSSIGGAQASAKAGVAHIIGKTDLETIKEARKIIAMLPGNNLEDVPFSIQAEDNINRELAGLNEIDAIADMRDIMARAVDHGEIMELSAGHAPEIVTALARIGGATVGLIGNQPSIDEGRLTAEGCRKAARFVRFLDCFSIPMVTFVDTAGPSVTGHPQADLIKACAQLMYAYAETTAPRIALVTGNAIGTGAAALSSRASADAVYAWPGSVISPVNAPAAVQILYRDQLRGASDPIVMRAGLEQKYQTEVADGLNAAQAGLVDDIIEPAATRQMLAAALYMLSGKRTARPAKKHGNLPL